jgi:hypothetical protein
VTKKIVKKDKKAKFDKMDLDKIEKLAEKLSEEKY